MKTSALPQCVDPTPESTAIPLDLNTTKKVTSDATARAEMTALGTPEQQRRLRILSVAPAQTLMVHEIYTSIQGESTFAGLPCTFVRLTGCPLRCRWCDTPHAFGQGEPRTISEIVSAVQALPPALVELTGGEPLAQPLAWPLLTALADTGKHVLLETSGAWPIDGIDSRVTIIMDLKCPGSGEASSNRWDNLPLLKSTDQIKFVMANRADFDWAVSIIRQYGLEKFPLLLSPVFGELAPADLVTWILAEQLHVRFQLQLHKFIWPPDQRGV